MKSNMEWMGDSNKAVIFIRRSSQRQKDNNSAETQLREIESYCRKAGLKIVHRVNLIESAKSAGSRKMYNKGRSSALKKKTRHLVFYTQDRETRNLTDSEANEDLVRKNKIVIHYASDRKVIHNRSPEGDFFTRDINSVMSKQFSRVLSKRVGAAMCTKAEDGWYPGNRPPLGYKHQKRLDPEGREMKRGTIIIPDPKTVDIVTSEFKLRAEGYSYADIRTINIRNGLIPKKSKSKYVKTAIEKRLKNKFYRGRFDWAGKEYSGNHPLIVSKSILARVDNTFKGRNRSRKLSENEDVAVLFSGWISCTCGCNVIYDPKTKIRKGSGKDSERERRNSFLPLCALY